MTICTRIQLPKIHRYSAEIMKFHFFRLRASIVSLCVVVDAVQYIFPAASWLKRNEGDGFAARNCHGVAVFKNRIWLTGGRSEFYQQYNLEYSQSRGDIWSSADGKIWEKHMQLQGDFYVQNFDALNPGPLAPWWARYGHSLDACSAFDNVGGKIEVLVLMGGFTPNPNNDIWLSVDGNTWQFAGHAPWSKRAWHATTHLKEKLLILGGTPLVNDVWQLDKIWQEPSGLWNFTWVQKTSASPWSPRVGLGVTVLEVDSEPRVFITGGYGGWPRDSIQWDGERSRSDIWSSLDGATWTLITDDAPWPPRAWHTLVTWSSLTNFTADVISAAEMGSRKARMWLTGGGYIGSKGNNVVYKMISLMDMWWSYDGKSWSKVNYEEGSGNNAYSSMEWTASEVEGKNVHLGRWGHQMVVWNDTIIAEDGSSSQIPALYLVAGDTTGAGLLKNDVYISNHTLLCSLNGTVCSNMGICNGFSGCSCKTGSSGDFCEVQDRVVSGASRNDAASVMLIISTISCAVMSLL